MEKYKAILGKYLPDNTAETIVTSLQRHKAHLRISRGRSTKLGDYRPPQNGKGHQISVNHDLNKYAFLITLVHELAHLVIYEEYGNRVKPHGKEWKQTYRLMMEPFMTDSVFPDDIHAALENYLSKSYASSGADINLSRVLQQYDDDPGIALESIAEGSIFRLSNGRIFKKGPRVRKRYRCLRLDNQRVYLVNPLARVSLPDSDDSKHLV